MFIFCPKYGVMISCRPMQETRNFVPSSSSSPTKVVPSVKNPPTILDKELENKSIKLALKQDNISKGRLQIIQKKLQNAYGLELQLVYDHQITHLLIDTDDGDHEINNKMINEFCGYEVKKPYPFQLLSLNWLIDWYGDKKYNFENRPDSRDYMLECKDDDDDNLDYVNEDERDDEYNDSDYDSSMTDNGIDSGDEGANQNIVSVLQQLHDIYKMEGGKEQYRARYVIL